MYFCILNHYALSSVGICNELTLDSSQSYFRRTDNAFDWPRLLLFRFLADVPLGGHQQMCFMLEKDAVYFGMVHENI
jgi:hypothetical protein